MQHRQQSFVLKGKRVTLYRPTSLEVDTLALRTLV